jgi:hypothetical protein
MKFLLLAMCAVACAACTCEIKCTGTGCGDSKTDGLDGDSCKALSSLNDLSCKAVGGSGCSYSCPCFPADAIVALDNGNKKKMADLAVGDKVLTHNGVFSEVFMFSHRLEEASYNFIELKTATTTLAITPNHYLYVNGNLREAQYVSAGDSLTLASGKLDKVLSVGRVKKDGIYNPHTLQGDIVVDGVLTSTYTSAFSPTLAHVVLAPLRGLYQMGVDIFKLDIGNALDQLPAWWKTMYAA